MANHYNFKRNYQPPSEDAIKKHQDFEALLAAYDDSQPTSQNRRIIRWLTIVGGLAAAASVLLLVFFNFNTDKAANYQALNQTYFEQRAYINPPLSKFQPQFASVQINANTGGVYEYESGSTLVIPAAAFVNDRGQLIEGNVDIKYREFHDYIDFFLSGIPMYYDSAEVRYNLESAGMIEVYAEQNGKRVKLAKDKSIDVQLMSAIEVPNINIPPSYNIYKLDTATRQWVYQNVDNIEVLLLEDIVNLNLNYQKAITIIETHKKQAITNAKAEITPPTPPIKPQTPSSDRATIELDFLDNLSNNSPTNALRDKYDGVVWQIATNSPPFHANAAKITWENYTLVQQNEQTFELTLLKGKQQLRLLLNPILTGTDYQMAINNYEKKLAEYEIELKEYNSKITELTTAITKDFEQQLLQTTKLYEQNLNKQTAQSKRRIVNRFKATSMGIWNCDRPIPPLETTVYGQFITQDGQPLDGKTAYLVDKSRNTIDKFLTTDYTPLTFNLKSDNLLWIVLSDNQLAIFKPEDFKQLKQHKKTQQFVLKTIKKVENANHIREYLEL